MLKAKKKITHREIKEDKLVTRFMQAETWALDNRRLLSYAGVGIVALVLIAFVWSNRVASREAEAATRLAKITPVFDAGNMQQAIDGIPAQGTFGLRSIADEYSDTHSGSLAMLYLADAFLAQQKAQEALKAFDDIDASERVLQGAVAAGKGVAQEMMKNYEDAARSFEKSVSIDPTSPVAPDRLLQSAACYHHAGMSERAREVLTTLKKQYPQSSVARDIERYLAEFAA